MKVTDKGQVTILKGIRDALRIGAGTEVEFERCNCLWSMPDLVSESMLCSDVAALRLSFCSL